MDITKNKNNHILIVDDKPLWSSYSETILNDNGYEVDTTESIHKVFELLKKDGYDLILVSYDTIISISIEIFNVIFPLFYKNRIVIMSEPNLSRTQSLSESRLAYKLGAKSWGFKPMGKKSLIDFIHTYLTKSGINNK